MRLTKPFAVLHDSFGEFRELPGKQVVVLRKVGKFGASTNLWSGRYMSMKVVMLAVKLLEQGCP